MEKIYPAFLNINQIRKGGQYSFVKKIMERKKYNCVIYILYVLLYQKALPGLRLNPWNTCNISMYIILMKRKEKKKRKYSFRNFSEHMQHYEKFRLLP